jgi:uncharacterized membrane protein affecting hemolysin expression
MCGYKHAFSRNLLLVIAISMILILMIIVLAIWDYLQARRSKKRKTQCAAYVANFSIRFAYEFFLEICLCVCIHVTAMEFNAEASGLLWAIAIILLIGIVLFVGFLVLLFFKGGPYVPGCYSPNSLKQSWWGIRPLCPATV